MRYLQLIWIDESTDEGPDPVEPWVEEMSGRGVRLQGSRLRPASDATTVRVRGDEVLLSDGRSPRPRNRLAGTT
jgi:hypothetical protein